MKTAERRGLSLLEVILAIAILAGAVAALGELIRTGLLNATDARDYTHAEMYAETVMSSIVAGALPVASVSNATLEDNPNYSYSIITEEAPSGPTGLLKISVTVARAQTSARKPAQFTLVRWMVDPEMEAELAAQAQANAQAAQAQSQSQQNSSSGGSTPTTGSGTSQQGGQQ
jgi:general secretion pathway protein I